MSQSDRDILFANEAFVIGVLHAVSGAGLVAGIAQSATLANISGATGLRIYLTGMAVGLLAAVLAAYWKHQYKLWDVKAAVSTDQEASDDARRRATKARCYLTLTRVAFVASVVAIATSICTLIVGIWS